MLVLTRRTGQSIYINEDIKIVVTDISGDKVKIGIEAPASYKIMREELRLTEETNLAASHSTASPRDLLRRLSGK